MELGAVSDIEDDRIAVVHRGESWSRRELAARAGRYAASLRRLGVVHGDVVAVAMPRGLDWFAAMLGIFEVGAAYMPVDPAYPASRQADMLRRARCRAVVRSAQMPDALGDALRLLAAEGGSAPLRLDGPPDQGPDEAERATIGRRLFEPSATTEVAYVLFTSGSTGAPKGAAITKAGLGNHLASKISFLGVGPDDRVAQTASAASDMSMWQLLAPWLVGARTCIVDDATVRVPHDLVAALVAAGVTVFDTVPSLLRVLLAETNVSAASLPSLRRLVVGGEVLPPSLCREWFARFPHVPIVNCYGPTECADGVTHEGIDGPPPAHVDRVSIGRPIEGMQAHVVDPSSTELVEVPPGATGELVVAGVGVGLGYVNDPDRSARVFVPNTLTSDPRFARAYRTGDLVRLLSDGRLEYLGRNDDQVKIRGYRVEPGEIEAHLSSCPEVSACAVVARPRHVVGASRGAFGAGDAPEDEGRMLVAYFVSAVEPTVDVLRRHLGARLPAHLIPERFVKVSALPLNANGKVDRRALPPPASLRPTLDAPYVEPAPGYARDVAEAWRSVLGLDRVGADDGFLALGGDSLLALSAVNAIRSKTGHNVSFAELLTSTVAEVALVLDRASKAAARPDAGASLAPAGAPAARVPFSPSQERYWARLRRDPSYAADHLGSTLRLRGRLDADALERCLAEIVRRHEPLRTTFHAAADGGDPFQVVHEAGTFVLARFDRRDRPAAVAEAEVRAECLRDATLPFDFAASPPLRATLFQISDDLHVLQIVMHHIVSDGWSWGIFANELALLYDAIASGKDVAAARLPQLALGYSDYARWAHAWLRGPDAARELSYWRSKLAGAARTLDIPTDRPRSGAPAHAAEVVLRSFSGAFAQAIDAFGAEMRVTPFMTFSAAFAILVGRLVGSQDVLFGSAIANRMDARTEPLIGCFGNGLLLRVDVSAGTAGADAAAAFRSILGRVRTTTLEAYEHQQILTETIIEDVFGPATPSSPLRVPQVVFALQNAPDEHRLRLGGVESDRLDVGLHTIKYDFVLEIHPRGNSYDVVWSYRTDLFDERSIVRLADELESILHAAISVPSL